MKEIVFPRHFRISALNSLLAKWEDACSSGEREVLLDLSNVYYFTPFAACFLASLADELLEYCRVRHLKISSPKRKNAAKKFDYFGLREYLFGEERKKSHMVHRITRPDYDLAFRLAGLVAESLSSISKDNLYAIQLGLRELLQNAFEHAESEAGVYVCAEGIKTRRVVRICVLDRGIGIKHHLARNPKYEKIASDEEAIKKCVKMDVSGDPDRSRGLGLYYLSRTVEDASGEMWIASGNALSKFEGRRFVASSLLERDFSGTVVEVLFKMTKEYKFKLDDYEEPLF